MTTPLVEHLCIDCKKLPVKPKGTPIKGVEYRPDRPRPRWAQAKPDDPFRCTTHGRAFKEHQRSLARNRNIESFGGITAEEYWAMYEAQGRKCAMPRCRATGKVKRLAIDHDHEYARLHCSHDPKTGACRNCIRGLLCGPHNYELLGKFRVDLQDAIDYLATPPAGAILAATGRDVLVAEEDLDRV